MRLIEIWVSHWFIWFSHSWEVVFVFALTFKLPQTIPIEKQGMCVCCCLWSLNTGIMKLWMVLHGGAGGGSWYEVLGTHDVYKVGGTLGTTGS